MGLTSNFCNWPNIGPCPAGGAIRDVRRVVWEPGCRHSPVSPRRMPLGGLERGRRSLARLRSRLLAGRSPSIDVSARGDDGTRNDPVAVWSLIEPHRVRRRPNGGNLMSVEGSLGEGRGDTGTHPAVSSQMVWVISSGNCRSMSPELEHTRIQPFTFYRVRRDRRASGAASHNLHARSAGSNASGCGAVSRVTTA